MSAIYFDERATVRIGEDLCKCLEMMWRRMGRFGAVRAVVLFCFAGCSFRLLGATRFTEIRLDAMGMDQLGHTAINIDYNRLLGIDESILWTGLNGTKPVLYDRPYAENLFPQIEHKEFLKVYIPTNGNLVEHHIIHSGVGKPSSVGIREGNLLAVPMNALFSSGGSDDNLIFISVGSGYLRLHKFTRTTSGAFEPSEGEEIGSTEEISKDNPITFSLALDSNESWFVTKSKLWWRDSYGGLSEKELTFEPLGFLWRQSVVYLSALRSINPIYPDEHYIQLYEVGITDKTVKELYQSSVVKVSKEARLPVRFINEKIYLTYVDKSHRVESIIFDIADPQTPEKVVLIEDLRKTFGFNALRMISAFVVGKTTTVMLESENYEEYFVAWGCDSGKIKGDLFFTTKSQAQPASAWETFQRPTAINLVDRKTFKTKNLIQNYYKTINSDGDQSLAYMHGRAFNSNYEMLLFTNPSSGSLFHCCGICNDLKYIDVMDGTPFAVTTYRDKVFLSVEGKDFGQRIYRFTIENGCDLKLDKKLFYETSENDKVPYRIQYLAAAPHKDPITKKSTSLLYASGYTNAVTLLSAQSTEYLLEERAVFGPIHMFYARHLDVGVLMATMTSPKLTTVLYQVHLEKEAHIALQLDNPYRAKFGSNFIVGDGWLNISKLEPYGDPPATSFYTLDQGLYCSLGILTSIWLLVSNIMRHDAKVLES